MVWNPIRDFSKYLHPSSSSGELDLIGAGCSLSIGLFKNFQVVLMCSHDFEHISCSFVFTSAVFPFWLYFPFTHLGKRLEIFSIYSDLGQDQEGKNELGK